MTSARRRIDVVCSSARQRADVGPMRRGVGPTSANDVGPTSRSDVGPTSSCLLGPPKNCTFPWRDPGPPPKMVPWAHQSPYPKHLRPTRCGVCAPAAPQICTLKPSVSTYLYSIAYLYRIYLAYIYAKYRPLCLTVLLGFVTGMHFEKAMLYTTLFAIQAATKH